MLRPDVDEAGGEAPRADSAERRRPGLGEAADPDDARVGAADRLGEAQRRGAGPLHADDLGDTAERLNRVEADGVVAEIENDRQPVGRIGYAPDVSDDAAWGDEGVGQLVDH